MKNRGNWTPFGRRLPAYLSLVACLVMIARPASSEEPPPPAFQPAQIGSDARFAQAAGEEVVAVPEGEGMTIYIDPQTGEIRQEPAPGTAPLLAPPSAQGAFSTSSQGLIQVPSSVPGGGIKLGLQGRFQSPLVATIDASGKLRMEHLDEAPGSH